MGLEETGQAPGSIEYLVIGHWTQYLLSHTKLNREYSKAMLLYSPASAQQVQAVQFLCIPICLPHTTYVCPARQFCLACSARHNASAQCSPAECSATSYLDLTTATLLQVPLLHPKPHTPDDMRTQQSFLPTKAAADVTQVHPKQCARCRMGYAARTTAAYAIHRHASQKRERYSADMPLHRQVPMRS